MAIADYLHQSGYKVATAPVSLFDGTAGTGAITLTGTWPVGRTGRIKVAVSSVAGHTDCAGTIVAGTETLTFTQAATKTTTVNLTANPVVTAANLDCHCHITVIDVGGTDILAETLTTIALRFESHTTNYQNAQGNWTQSQARAYVADATIVSGSKIRYNSTDYVVQAIKSRLAHDGTETFRTLLF